MAELEFKLQVSHLLDKHAITWTIPPASLFVDSLLLFPRLALDPQYSFLYLPGTWD
jgi:hypothetical protein